jgi:hypothetical protein
MDDHMKNSQKSSLYMFQLFITGIRGSHFYPLEYGISEKKKIPFQL